MKFKIEKKHISMGVVALAVIVCAILFFLILTNFQQIFSVLGQCVKVLASVIWGFVIAYFLTPILNFFERKVFSHIKFKKPHRGLIRGLSIAVTLIIVLLAASGLMWMVIPQILASIRGIIVSIPTYISNAQQFLNDTLERYPDVEELFQNYFTDFANMLTNLAQQLLPTINSSMSNVTSGVFGFIYGFKDFVIGLLVSIYVMASKEKFIAQSKKVLYAFIPKKAADKTVSVCQITHRTFYSFLSGKLLDSLIIGIICFIVMVIFGWEYPLLISVVIGLFNIIPFFGPIIGAVPCILILLFTNPFHALMFLIFTLLLQTFDSQCGLSHTSAISTGLPAFWVIFAILVGGGIGGIVGMFVAVPIFSVIYSLFRASVGERLTKRGLSADTADYYPEEPESQAEEAPEESDENTPEETTPETVSEESKQ